MAKSTTEPRPAHEALGGRPPGPGRRPPGAPLGARDGAVPRRLGAPRAAGSSRGRRSRTRSGATWPPRSTCATSPTSSSSRRGASPGAIPSEWLVATAYLGLVPADVDPRVPERHRLAPGRRAARDGVRPRRDRARGPRAAPREALVHEHRLRARPARRSRSPSFAASTVPRSATTSRPRTSSACSSVAACSSRPARRALPVAPAAARPPSTASPAPASRSPTRSPSSARRTPAERPHGGALR